jgi:type I restriction enzyme M protein
MVELVKRTPDDVICDPASGTCGFLSLQGNTFENTTHLCSATTGSNGMFHGYDFDNTMLRIGAMYSRLRHVKGQNR